MFQVDQKRGEELKGVKVKRKQPSYWGAIEELLRSCKNCCGIISEWVSETNYKIGEATLGSPFVHVFLRSENPSLGIRDTLKRWSSLLNTRLCIPRVSGSSPPSSTNTIMFIIVIFTCFRCWEESEDFSKIEGNLLIKFQPSAQTEAGWQLTVVLTAEKWNVRSAVSCELIFELKGRSRWYDTMQSLRRGFRFQILYQIWWRGHKGGIKEA